MSHDVILLLSLYIIPLSVYNLSEFGVAVKDFDHTRYSQKFSRGAIYSVKTVHFSLKG